MDDLDRNLAQTLTLSKILLHPLDPKSKHGGYIRPKSELCSIMSETNLGQTKVLSNFSLAWRRSI